MTPTLEDIKGLGNKITVFKDAGIDSVEKLAEAKVEDLTELKGVGQATAEKLIASAKQLLEEKQTSEKDNKNNAIVNTEDEKNIQEELKKLEDKKKSLQGKKIEKDDYVLVKITAKNQKGRIFQVSSEEDAKKTGIYNEENAKHGYYEPEFVIVGKPGFLNEGLTETLEGMNFFEKKSVRIPPNKAFGKRDPSKIERIGIAKFKKLNEGKNPELGQDFVKKGTGQRGTVTNIMQGKVIIDYNHPLAGQSIDYNIEVIDKIEDFKDKIKYFMINKGIPKENVEDFKINYEKSDKSLEIIIPKMFLFQNLTYIKFGLAMDLHNHMVDEIGDIKFVEIYEKMSIPISPSDSVLQKVDDYNKEHDHNHD